MMVTVPLTIRPFYVMIAFERNGDYFWKYYVYICYTYEVFYTNSTNLIYVSIYTRGIQNNWNTSNRNLSVKNYLLSTARHL